MYVDIDALEVSWADRCARPAGHEAVGLAHGFSRDDEGRFRCHGWNMPARWLAHRILRSRQHRYDASRCTRPCPSPKPHPTQLTTADALATGQGASRRPGSGRTVLAGRRRRCQRKGPRPSCVTTRQDDCCVVVVQYLADIRRSMAIHARPTAERRCEDAHHLTRRRPPREPGGVISGVLVLPMWSKGARVIREMRQSSFARTKSQSLTSLPGGSGPYVAR